MKATIDRSKFETPDADPNNPSIEYIDKKYTEKERTKSQQDLELKQWNSHKLVGQFLYNIVWGQCDDAMKEELKQQTEFATVSTGENIIGLLKTMDAVFLVDDFG